MPVVRLICRRHTDGGNGGETNTLEYLLLAAVIRKKKRV